jgi:hypothetical protein
VPHPCWMTFVARLFMGSNSNSAVLGGPPTQELRVSHSPLAPRAQCAESQLQGDNAAPLGAALSPQLDITL